VRGADRAGADQPWAEGLEHGHCPRDGIVLATDQQGELARPQLGTPAERRGIDHRDARAAQLLGDLPGLRGR